MLVTAVSISLRLPVWRDPVHKIVFMPKVEEIGKGAREKKFIPKSETHVTSSILLGVEERENFYLICSLIQGTDARLN